MLTGRINSSDAFRGTTLEQEPDRATEREGLSERERKGERTKKKKIVEKKIYNIQPP